MNCIHMGMINECTLDESDEPMICFVEEDSIIECEQLCDDFKEE